MLKRLYCFLAVILSMQLCGLDISWASSSGTHWSYGGHDGPANWGSLSPEYAVCSAGRSQSPIDISHTVPSSMGDLEFDYRNTPLRLINNGHAIQVNYGTDSFMRMGGKVYKLLQFHFHSLSENTHHGKNTAMEVHLVHKNDQGELAVVAVFIEEGKYNPFIQKLWDNMPHSVGQENVLSQLQVNALELLPANGSYYHWSGSLTTPPCSEGVMWYMMKDPIEVSADQVKQFVSIIGLNNRPVQPLQGRQVYEITTGRVVQTTIAHSPHSPSQQTAHSASDGHTAASNIAPPASHSTDAHASNASMNRLQRVPHEEETAKGVKKQKLLNMWRQKQP